MKTKWKIIFGVLLVIGLMMFALTAMADSSTVVSGTVPLVINNVSSSGITYNSATIGWNTNGAANSQVFYGTTSYINDPNNDTTLGKYNSSQTPNPNTPVTAHSVPLSGLNASTTYYYRVKSVAVINSIQYTAISSEYYFTTLAASKLGTMTIIYNVSPEPSSYGQSVTFNVLVLSTWFQGVPSGTVKYYDSATYLGYSTLGQLGFTSFSISTLVVGNHPITAVYMGDDTFAGDTSNVDTHTVKKASTSTGLSSSVNPSVYGQSVTFTATVTGPGAIPPAGGVTFKDGNTVLNTTPIALSGGSALFSTTALTVGSHNITASYGGDGNYNSSTSSTVKQTVNKVPTAMILSSTINPSVYGQSVTFTATITPKITTGSVTFKDGSSTLGTGSFNSSGVATFTTSALSVASHVITAVYAGDTTNSGSTSNTVTQVVNQITTATTLNSSLNPSTYGQSVKFTATVSAVFPGTGTPTGKVQFQIDGANFGGAVTLSGGSATSGATTSLAAGNHTVTAIYNGSTNFGTSTGNLSQVVNKAPTTITLTSSVNPSTFGQTVKFIGSVTPNTATGTVTFYDSSTSTTLGTISLLSGSASVSMSNLAVGSHSITATYNDGGNYAGSTSNTVTQKVVAKPVIQTTTLPNGTKGSSYSQPLVVTGGQTPFSWSISSGSLPNGLSVNSSTGIISGTPSKTGTFSFMAKVTDSLGNVATQSLSIKIN